MAGHIAAALVCTMLMFADKFNNSAASSPMSPAVTAGLLPASAAEGFPALEFIRDPGEARIMFADSFNDGCIPVPLFPSEQKYHWLGVLSQLSEGVKKLSGPVNMAVVYRQSLMSPQNIFRERGRGGRLSPQNIFRERGRGGQMVLSERHKILRRCLEKAEGRRLFTGEGVSGGCEW